MGLLQDIQAELLDPKAPIGPILLKLRYLAAKLGSDVLEQWVKFETEGYPEGVDVPEYRMGQLAYSGTFTNEYQTINNAPIPQYLIEQHAGPNWVNCPIKDSIAVIDKLVSSENLESEMKLGIAAGNLIPLLHNKVYEGMGAISIKSTFSGAPFRHIHNIVRAKILDLTLELEKQVPVASEVAIGSPIGVLSPATAASITQITSNVFYGNQTNISNTAMSGGSIQVQVVAGDMISLVQFLVERGVPEAEAKDLAQIVAEEGPENADQPLGEKAKGWLGKVAGGAWGVTKEVGTQILIEGLKGFYGLGS